MLNLLVNGESKKVNAPCDLAQALTELGFIGNHFAVAVNGRFVPRSQYEKKPLSGGESLEVLTPMAGG